MTHWLPIGNNKHTEVLGFRPHTRIGKKLWSELDWSSYYWIDYSEKGHVFSPARCMYLHVDCKSDGKVYRVRCWYAGRKYKRKPVVSVSIGFKNGKPHWIVRTEAAR